MIFFCLPFKFNLKSQELPHEALAAGTVVASTIVQKMTGQDVFGTVAPGKRADLLLLGKNPLEDVTNAVAKVYNPNTAEHRLLVQNLDEHVASLSEAMQQFILT